MFELSGVTYEEVLEQGDSILVRVIGGSSYRGFELSGVRVIGGSSYRWFELSGVRVIGGSSYRGFELSGLYCILTAIEYLSIDSGSFLVSKQNVHF